MPPVVKVPVVTPVPDVPSTPPAKVVVPNTIAVAGFILIAIAGGLQAIPKDVDSDVNYSAIAAALVATGTALMGGGALLHSSNAKDQEAKSSDALSVSAVAPAIIPEGENPVKFRLRLAMSDAIQAEDYETTGKILEMMKGVKS